MLFDIALIPNLTTEVRKKLVDYIEGMPSKLSSYVKMHILDSYMDPSFFNSTKRDVHPFSTVGKYIKPKCNYIQNPADSVYQSEYCSILSDIEKSDKFPQDVKVSLGDLLGKECYDLDSLIHTEAEIGWGLNQLSTDRKYLDYANGTLAQDFAFIVTTKIMPYKYKVCDLYTYLLINPEMQLRECDYNQMSYKSNMITYLITHPLDMTSLHDLAILLYIYFKDIGMEKFIEKYNLLARFVEAMRSVGVSDDQIQEFITDINEYIDSQTSPTEASATIINSDKLSKIDKDTHDEIPVLNVSPNMDENNGFIFSFKDIKNLDPDKLDELSLMLRSINKDEISHYIDIPVANIYFDLNDNDIGHIRNDVKMNTGTAYNSFTKEILYIAEKDGEFYVLFKNRMNSRIVYGISIKRYAGTDDNTVSTFATEGNKLPRKLMTIKENTNYYYKFISEI